MNFPINDAEVLRKLSQVKGASEVYKKTTYELVRERSDGKTQRLQVTILDAGTSVRPEFRFMCEVIADDGTGDVSNQASDPQEAVAIMHWTKFDPPA
jgi:hypothetical protein